MNTPPILLTLAIGLQSRSYFLTITIYRDMMAIGRVNDRVFKE